MGDTLIKWTPRGESTEQTLNVTNLGIVFRIQRQASASSVTNISIGRKAITIVRPSLAVYEVEIVSIDRDANPSGDDYPYGTLASWRSHVEGGGEFIFNIDASNDFETTLNGALTLGDTTLTLTASASGNVAVGDWLYIEDKNDSSKWELRRAKTVTAAIVTNEGVSYGFADDSTVRHEDYYPKCLLVRGSLRFPERQAGQGVDMHDLRFRFETVR